MDFQEKSDNLYQFNFILDNIKQINISQMHYIKKLNDLSSLITTLNYSLIKLDKQFKNYSL